MNWDSNWVFYPLNIITLAIIVYYPPPNRFSFPILIGLLYSIGYVARGRHEKRKEKEEDNSEMEFSDSIQ